MTADDARRAVGTRRRRPRNRLAPVNSIHKQPWEEPLESDPQSALGYLNRGIDAFENGNLELAKRHFAQALSQEPDDALAWLWLSEASQNPGEQRYCLDRAAALDPDSAGIVKRDALRAANVKPVVPPVIKDLAKPQLPPSFRKTASPRTIPIRKKLPIRKEPERAATKPPLRNPRFWIPLAALAFLLLAGAWWIFSREVSPDRDHVYVAVVAPLTGESAAIGQGVRNAAIIAQNDFNMNVTDGPRIELLFFDDSNDPELAPAIAEQIVADERIVGVIGHGTSSTSIAAAPIYAAANMPVVSGQATIDSLSDYPNYFRTIFSNSDEARIVANYLYSDLGQERASIVSGTSVYETSLAAGFEEAFGALGEIEQSWTIGDDQQASIAAIVEEMQQADEAGKLGALFLATTEDNGYELLLQLRDAGLDPIIMGSETLGTEQFADRFTFKPRERSEPGFYTGNMYAVSPLLYDSVGGAAYTFAERYRDLHQESPDWRGPKVWEAVTALAVAAERGEVTNDTSLTGDYRNAIVRELGKMTSPETGFAGLSGPVFFTESRRSPQGLSIGKFESGMLLSAPVQYRLIDNPTNYDIDAELEAGTIVELDGYYFRPYRVVYVGFEMNELRDLSTADQSYTADFYIYFRYTGDDQPLNIMFTNAASADLGLGEPMTSSVTKEGMNYRLYRVRGTFSQPMDFSDYPWDQHQLSIRFQNPELTQNDLVYVADPVIVQSSQEDRMRSSFDLARPFNRVPSWLIDSVNFEQVSVMSTADDYDTEGNVYYSEFRVLLNTEREVSSFLAKNMLPLILLALVTYIAIWFPAEQAGARIGFAITAMLSSAVMLNSISSQLPDIGYNVAIEWGYYAYIGLSAVLVLLTIAVDRAYKAKRFGRVRRLDGFIRLMYPLTIVGIMALYAMVYRSDTRPVDVQESIRNGVMLISFGLLILSAVIVFLPDRLRHSLTGHRNHWFDLPAEEEPAGQDA